MRTRFSVWAGTTGKPDRAAVGEFATLREASAAAQAHTRTTGVRTVVYDRLKVVKTFVPVAPA